MGERTEMHSVICVTLPEYIALTQIQNILPLTYRKRIRLLSRSVTLENCWKGYYHVSLLAAFKQAELDTANFEYKDDVEKSGIFSQYRTYLVIRDPEILNYLMMAKLQGEPIMSDYEYPDTFYKKPRIRKLKKDWQFYLMIAQILTLDPLSNHYRIGEETQGKLLEILPDKFAYKLIDTCDKFISQHLIDHPQLQPHFKSNKDFPLAQKIIREKILVAP